MVEACEEVLEVLEGTDVVGSKCATQSHAIDVDETDDLWRRDASGWQAPLLSLIDDQLTGSAPRVGDLGVEGFDLLLNGVVQSSCGIKASFSTTDKELI